MEFDEFIKLISYLTEKINETKDDSITPEKVEEALYILLADKFDFNWRGSLWDINITSPEALELLNKFDFDTLSKTITTTEDIIPSQFLFSRKVRVKSKGLIWVVHKYDADPFPSNPHAHLLDTNIKLDLSTGNCFHIRKYVHTISKKELLEIREKIEKVYTGTLPPISC